MGSPHEHAFVKGPAKRTCRVKRERSGAVSVIAGVKELEVLKTTNSAFVGFPAG